MNQTFAVLPVATRDTNGESEVFTNESTTENPGAGVFVVTVDELDPGAHVVVAVLAADDTYVLASNRIDRPGRYPVVIGSGLGVESPSVYAPQTVLPDAFKASYVVANGAVKFGVEAAVI